MRRRLGVVVCPLVVVLTASACTGSSSPSPDETPPSGTSPPGPRSFVTADGLTGEAPKIPGAKPGGTVTILGTTDFDNADPQATYRRDAIVIYTQLLVRTLTGYYEEVGRGGKIQIKLAGDLATNTGTSEDGCRTWTYTLREGITFQDGTKITSRDIAYGISRSFDRRLAGGPQYLQRALAGRDDYRSVYSGPFDNRGTIAPGISTPADDIIVFRFARPFCDFPLAATLPTTVPVPADKDPGPGEYGRNIVASGPYQIDSWTRGQKMVLVRNGNWVAGSDPLRHNYPDRYIFDWSSGDSAGVSDRLVEDEGGDSSAVQWDTVPVRALEKVLGALNSRSSKVRAVEGDGPGNTYISINTQRVTDIDVRRALQYAINRRAILELIGGGHNRYVVTPSSTITAPTVPGYKKYDAYPAGPEGNVQKAKDLLAGKTPTLRFCYRPGTTLRERIAVATKQNLERAGFRIVLSPTNAESHYALIGNRAYAMTNPGCDLMTTGWAQDYPSNATVMGVLMRGGHAIRAEGNVNWSYLDVPQVNAELDRLAAEPNVQKAAEGYLALDKKVMEDHAPLIPIYYGHVFSLVGSQLGGVSVSSTWGSVSLQDCNCRDSGPPARRAGRSAAHGMLIRCNI